MLTPLTLCQVAFGRRTSESPCHAYLASGEEDLSWVDRWDESGRTTSGRWFVSKVLGFCVRARVLEGF